jgi:hypothetical protein
VSELDVYRWLLLGEFVAGVGTFIALRLVNAPYGRYARSGFGPTVDARLGWLLMESPAVLFFLAVYIAGEHRAQAAPLALCALWQIHYVHRTFIFPATMPATGRRMPVMIALLAVLFNLQNGYLNARWLSQFGSYPPGYLGDWRFLVGAPIFVLGLIVNIVSDRHLLKLRAGALAGYQVPRGGLFEWVSCPNYLGEMTEWFGFALAAWSPAALAFALYTVANLAPRAAAHHAWYRERFSDYPASRRVLIPLVW